uniref:BY PROTMAP: gi/342319316/gb/EGU11265.1/ Proteophosphoglycan 5 [Rhodotorula glutinis ATCC 204091] n=2 Tax=Rhodotorula toruloides TaxID=5286 RepID=A0A0K3CCH5_RHOTO
MRVTRFFCRRSILEKRKPVCTSHKYVSPETVEWLGSLRAGEEGSKSCESPPPRRGQPTRPPRLLTSLILGHVEDAMPFWNSSSRWTSFNKQFSELCLVSRSFLPVARRRLYKQPLHSFRCGASDRAHRAVSLVESLQANNNHLGGLVKDLAYLANVYDSLSAIEDSIDSHSFQQRGQTKAFSWLLGMVAACGRAQRVNIAFESALQLPKLFRTLASSDMTSLSLRPFNNSAADALSPRMLSSLSPAAKLSDLTLDLQRLDIAAGTSTKPQLSLKLQKLSIRGESAPLTYVLQYLPTDSTFLREVDLFVAGAYSQDRLLELVRHAPHLTKLRMRRSPFPEYAYRRDSYGAGGAALLVPHEFYTLLPNLEDLQLRGFAALSLKRLSLLAEHSPKLAHLDFVQCVWVKDDATSALFPVDHITRALLAFKQLEYAHLGVVPVSDSAMAPCEAALTGKTELLWISRDIPCSSCGEYHIYY